VAQVRQFVLQGQHSTVFCNKYCLTSVHRLSCKFLHQLSSCPGARPLRLPFDSWTLPHALPCRWHPCHCEEMLERLHCDAILLGYAGGEGQEGRGSAGAAHRRSALEDPEFKVRPGTPHSRYDPGCIELAPGALSLSLLSQNLSSRGGSWYKALLQGVPDAFVLKCSYLSHSCVLARHDVPACTAQQYAELYAEDEKAFFKDYAIAHKRLSELGSKFDPRRWACAHSTVCCLLLE